MGGLKMFTLSIAGSIAILGPCDQNAQNWASVYLEGYQPDSPHFFYIEIRFLQGILEALKGFGFTVKSE